MATKKKNRQRNFAVYIIYEGDREAVFYNYLVELYKPTQNRVRITFENASGGSPEAIICQAIKQSCSYPRVYALFDEDKAIEESEKYEIYKKLGSYWCLQGEIENEISLFKLSLRNEKKRNPIFIISRPFNFNGFLIRILEKKLPDITNKGSLKSALGGVFQGRFDREKELQYYRDNLSKEILEERAKLIPELRLLLSVFQP